MLNMGFHSTGNDYAGQWGWDFTDELLVDFALWYWPCSSTPSARGPAQTCFAFGKERVLPARRGVLLHDACFRANFGSQSAISVRASIVQWGLARP